MRSPVPGLACLIGGYTLSQFYRAFLAVLAPTLGAEIGARPGDLAVSSGMWFLTFALAQLPIGWALDAVGPRRTAATLLALGGGGGAALFALATAPWHLHVAMGLIGIGCAPVLMAAYFLIARGWPPTRFGPLAGLAVAVGSAGNILSATPLVRAIEAFGWRPTLWALTALTLAVAGLVVLLVRDPAPEPRPTTTTTAPRAALAALAELLRIRALWWLLPLMFINYAPAAAIRGVWAAPYLAEIHAADPYGIGRGTLVMGVAVIAGNLLLGPLVRLAGSARRVAIWGSAGTCLALTALVLRPDAPLPVATALLAAIGLSGALYALTMAHGRAFLPPHLIGFGITFLNMVSIAGVGIMQFATRPIYRLPADDPAETFARLFLAFLVPLAAGLGLYLRSPDAQRR